MDDSDDEVDVCPQCGGYAACEGEGWRCVGLSHGDPGCGWLALHADNGEPSTRARTEEDEGI